MNELIEHLAREAGIRFTNYGSGNFIDDGDCNEDHLETFARLVALECAEIAVTRTTTKAAAKVILERFGL